MHRRGSTLGKAISNGRRKVRAADCIAMARLVLPLSVTECH
jgi:hypothetical protein